MNLKEQKNEITADDNIDDIIDFLNSKDDPKTKSPLQTGGQIDKIILDYSNTKKKNEEIRERNKLLKQSQLIPIKNYKV